MVLDEYVLGHFLPDRYSGFVYFDQKGALFAFLKQLDLLADMKPQSSNPARRNFVRS